MEFLPSDPDCKCPRTLQEEQINKKLKKKSQFFCSWKFGEPYPLRNILEQYHKCGKKETISKKMKEISDMSNS
jgi:hypothetical protein